MTTICLCRGDDDDGIKGTGVVGRRRASSGVVDHIGLGGEGHDGDGRPRGGDYDAAPAGGLASVLRLTEVG